MNTILHHGDEARGRYWREVFAREMPGVDFLCHPDGGDWSQVRFLVAWTLTPEVIAALPALEVIFSIGAGVDQLDLSIVPPHVRVVRMIEPGITTTMAQYIVMATLALHRDLPFYVAEQRHGRWSPRDVRLCSERTVGFLGLGELARASIKALGPLGFRLTGWSRSTKAIAGVETYAGQEGLSGFLASTDILVCLLPLTDATRGILCRDLFERLPRGAAIVNAARGGHLVDGDLTAALDEGLLSAAFLDVASTEPLAEGHPFYSNPRIFLTPHISGVTRPETAVHALITNLRCVLANDPVAGEVDRARGY
ncbi:2-hydroxyacid dehydrogenase [Novosphingobium album (ex Hu et al. 2023)]|uniref:Glyoxylate/hydroxypyruvate reductase A n=1 Tax=Novosphingobium album (ex Hu et al. 2023) TaxID=2930093 RepID=A0ABT0B7C4_9SPHN|nr:glyoxylate/hydroxypyruvate reductase A [Novosphingobium album (ex Hu et al. 2023)]MCJ2180913.1 glyoxylate/hydroxypyruvate reductase A [Novosphingobium album (ex Hu et al. 2023)]